MRRLNRRILLIAEELEPRWVPTAYTWDPSAASTNKNWKNPDNWAPAGIPSGSGDSVLFQAKTPSGVNSNCIVDAGVSIGSVNLNGYGLTLFLDGTFTVDSLTMNVAVRNGNVANPTIAAADEPAKLIINKEFIWNSGNLIQLPVDITSGAVMTVGFAKPAPMTSLSTRSTNIYISGILNWDTGDIAATGSNLIQINSFGSFNINVDKGYDWGSGPKTLSVVNNGSVTSNASSFAFIEGNYTNNAFTTINKGTLSISGNAVQNGDCSLTTLNSGSIELTNPNHILNINAGFISGNGTITGNLTLGTSTTSATIIPGGSTAPPIGSLNVTNSFAMFNGEMQIYIFSGTQYGVMNVGTGTDPAYADLSGGSVVGLLQGANPSPATITFLNYPLLLSDFKETSPPALYSYQFNPGWVPLPNVTLAKMSQFVPTGAGGGALAGTVFVNNDGTNAPDSSNPGLSGATVSIYDSSNTLVASTTSASDGTYSLTGITAGTYTVQTTVPSGYVDNGSSSTLSTSMTITSGQTVTNNVAAYSSSSPTSTSGNVFVDSDGSGLNDGVNPGLSGVTVSLETTSGGSVTNAFGGPVSSTTTNSSGNYSFTNLNPGTYQVVVSDPSGYSLEGTTSSTFTTTISSPGPNTVANEGVYQNASLGGTVSVGTSGLSGVSVELTDLSGDVLSSTTTASNGTYSFSTIAAGSYGLLMTAPSGYVFDGSSNTLLNTTAHTWLSSDSGLAS